MNKEQLEKRMQELETEIQRLVLSHSMLMGQLNECKYQISELDKAEAEAV